eukprot:3396705-Amphidinium_carterae.1
MTRRYRISGSRSQTKLSMQHVTTIVLVINRRRDNLWPSNTHGCHGGSSTSQAIVYVNAKTLNCYHPDATE